MGVFDRFLNIKRTTESRSAKVELSELNKRNSWPILCADDIISVLHQQSRITSIRNLLKLPEASFQHLAWQPLAQFILRVQLSPASAAHHHAGLGGLVIHQLEVIERALKLRQQYRLPLGGTTEDIALQEMIWTYGTFVAALGHDIAKSGINVSLKTEHGIHSLFTPPAPTGGDYQFVWHEPPRRLHEQLGPVVLGQLLPADAWSWLVQYPAVAEQVVNSVFDYRRPESGVIGQMIRDADAWSVSRNLLGPGARPVSGRIPLITKLHDALRYLIAEREISINRPGAAGWCDGAYVYLLPKVVLDQVVEYLHEMGDRSVPTNRERLMDILQEHGLALPTHDGRAIHYIAVQLDDWQQTFSALKFRASDLATIEPMDGQITEISEPEAASTTETGADSAENEQTEEQAAQTKETASVTTSGIMLPPGYQEHVKEESGAASAAESGAVSTTETGAASAENVGSPAEHGAARQDAEAGDGKQSAEHGTSPQEMAEQFVEWLVNAISEDDDLINTAKAWVHRVEQGLFVVSPLAFKKYAGVDEEYWRPVQNALVRSDYYSGRRNRAVISMVPIHKGRPGKVLNGIIIRCPNPLETYPVNDILSQVDLLS